MCLCDCVCVCVSIPQVTCVRFCFDMYTCEIPHVIWNLCLTSGIIFRSIDTANFSLKVVTSEQFFCG